MKYTTMEGALKMLIEKNILKSDLSYNDDKSKRYLLRVEWEKTKQKMCIIMLTSGTTNGISFDRTSNLVIENANRLNYGSVDMLNLFSSIDTDFDEEIDKDNMKIIETSAKNSDIIIFAVGTGHKSNKRIIKRQKDVLEMLKKYDKKLYCIADSDGRKFYHPLCPKVRKWNLMKFDIEEITKEGYNYA